MLLLAFCWLALSVVVVPVGLALLRFAHGGEAFDRLGDRLVVATWLGLLAFGVALQALSLDVALKPLIGLTAGAIGTGLALTRPEVRADLRALVGRLRGTVLLGGLALVVGVSAFVAQQVVWTDTGLYHASAIRWLGEHGAVPGEALVHSRFGYSSIWYDLTAPFSTGELRGRVAAVAGGFALLLAAAHLALVAARALGRRARLSDWLVLVAFAFVLPIASWWKQPISPNPDFPLVLLPVVVAWAIMCVQRAEPDPLRRVALDARVVPLALASGAAAIKLSGVALIAVAGLFYIWPPRLTLRRIGLAAAVVLAMLLPALTTGYVLSGCPLYPSGPCFDTAWSIPAEDARAEATAIRSFARGLGGDPTNPLTSTAWINPWLRSGQNLLLLLTVALGALAAWRAPPHLRWPIALGLVGAFFVLITAPALRFGLGYSGVLVAAFAMRYAAVLAARVPRLRRVAVPAVGLAASLAVVGVGFTAARAVRPTAERGTTALATPPAMQEPAVTAQTMNGVRYYVPAGDLCWSAPLPCTTDALVRSDARLRDPGVGLGAGFSRR